jgi:hypothetical protein
VDLFTTPRTSTLNGRKRNSECAFKALCCPEMCLFFLAQVLDYLAGGCFCRKYHIVLPPRAQRLLPAVQGNVRREKAVPDDFETMTQHSEATEKRDWRKGVAERGVFNQTTLSTNAIVLIPVYPARDSSVLSVCTVQLVNLLIIFFLVCLFPHHAQCRFPRVSTFVHFKSLKLRWSKCGKTPFVMYMGIFLGWMQSCIETTRTAKIAGTMMEGTTVCVGCAVPTAWPNGVQPADYDHRRISLGLFCLFRRQPWG